MNAEVRARVLARLRALMARSVANGATPDEELVAARMVGRLIGQIDSMDGTPPLPEPPPRPEAAPSWAQAELDSREYKQLLEKNTLEGLFKAAVQELALEHINTVSPPRRHLEGVPVERVDTRALLLPHLGMMLAPGGTQLARDLLSQSVEELIYDGALPPWLDIPVGD